MTWPPRGRRARLIPLVLRAQGIRRAALQRERAQRDAGTARDDREDLGAQAEARSAGRQGLILLGLADARASLDRAAGEGGPFLGRDRRDLEGGAHIQHAAA